jgi:hypothetical protein
MYGTDSREWSRDFDCLVEKEVQWFGKVLRSRSSRVFLTGNRNAVLMYIC